MVRDDKPSCETPPAPTTNNKEAAESKHQSNKNRTHQARPLTTLRKLLEPRMHPPKVALGLVYTECGRRHGHQQEGGAQHGRPHVGEADADGRDERDEFGGVPQRLVDDAVDGDWRWRVTK